MALRIDNGTLYAHRFPIHRPMFLSWLQLSDPYSMPQFAALEPTLFSRPRKYLLKCAITQQVAVAMVQAYFSLRDQALQTMLLEYLGRKPKQYPKHRIFDNIRKVHDYIVFEKDDGAGLPEGAMLGTPSLDGAAVEGEEKPPLFGGHNQFGVAPAAISVSTPSAVLFDVDGSKSLVTRIASGFLLDPQDALPYATMILFSSHRFECHKKRFAGMTFADWTFLASSIMHHWMEHTPFEMSYGSSDCDHCRSYEFPVVDAPDEGSNDRNSPSNPTPVEQLGSRFTAMRPAGSANVGENEVLDNLGPLSSQLPSAPPSAFPIAPTSSNHTGDDEDDAHQYPKTTDSQSSESDFEDLETTSREKPFVGFDPGLVESLITLRTKVVVDVRLRNVLRRALSTRPNLHSPKVFERIDRVATVLKALIQIGSQLGSEKEVRDLWVDIYEKVAEPCVDRLALSNAELLTSFVDVMADLNLWAPWLGLERHETNSWRRFCAVVRDAVCVFLVRCEIE
eukprot:ANDGO_00971.mRNA.1 hypothetical protein